MDARALATQLAAGRIAMGAGLAVAPGLIAGMWVGRDGARPGAKVVGSAMGARDLAIGVGILRALRGAGSPAPWLQAAAFADATDLVATLRARDDIPSVAVVGVGALAACSAGACLWLSRQLG